MSDDTLGNVTGRAWLVAELDRVATEVCAELAKAYPRFRRGRTGDRRDFIASVEALRNEAFLTARCVEDGGCDIRHVLSVFNWMAQLDQVVHWPDITLGRSKSRKDAATGFASKHEDHDSWRVAFEVARHELQQGGKRASKKDAAKIVVERLGLTVTPEHVSRMVQKIAKPD